MKCSHKITLESCSALLLVYLEIVVYWSIIGILDILVVSIDTKEGIAFKTRHLATTFFLKFNSYNIP